MKVNRILLAAVSAAVLSTIATMASYAAIPEGLNTYNDGTHTWVWNWDWRNNDKTASIQGYWDDATAEWTCGVSPQPTGKVVVPAKVVFKYVVEKYDKKTGDFIEVPMTEEIAVTAVESYLFKDCAGVTEVVLPDSVKTISCAFKDCATLATVNVPTSLEFVDGDSFYGTAWMGAQTGDFAIFGGFLLSYLGDATAVVIPDSVKAICNGAFSGCDTISSVSIPDGVTRIGNYAFYDCTKLATVTGANGVRKCGREAFEGTAIWDNAVDNAPVRVANIIVGYKGELGDEVDIEDGVTVICDEAFECCELLETASLPDSLLTIGDGAFANCYSLEDVELPDGLESIGENAFAECSTIESMEIPDSVTKIGDGAFDGCSSLWSLSIGSGVGELQYLGWLEGLEELFVDSASIGDGVFAELDNLCDVTFGENVKSIGCAAFSYCPMLDGIVIPAGVTAIGDRAFADCESLEDVEFEGDMDAIGMDVYEAFAETPWLQEWWIDHPRYIVDEDGVLLGVEFSPCYDWEEHGKVDLVIPEGVVEISEGCFCEWYEIRSVTLPSSLRRIGEEAFAWSSVETVSGLTDAVSVAPDAFRCTPYERALPFALWIDNNVLVGFKGACPASVDVPDGVVEIGESAFDNDMYYYELYDEATDGWQEFSQVSGLRSASLAASVATIDEYAFWGTGIETVTIANPDIKIDGSAFGKCTNLQAIVIEKKGHALVGWNIARYRNPYHYECDGDGECVKVEEAADFMPIGTSVQVDSIEPLIYGLPTGKTVTDWVRVEDDWMQSEVVETNRLAGFWVTPVWVKTTPNLIEGDAAAAAASSAFEGNAQYNGWLRDSSDRIVGTILLKAGKPNKNTGVSKLAATITMLADGKKLTFAGEAAAGGAAGKGGAVAKAADGLKWALEGVELKGKTGSFAVNLSGDAVSGEYGGYSVSAAKNVFVAKDGDSKAAASAVSKGSWTVTLGSAKGYTAFTITVANKGKAKITGTLPDGTKATVSAQTIVAGDHWCVPVVSSKKNKFGFVAWFEMQNGSTVLSYVSDLTSLVDAKGNATEWFAVEGAFGAVGALSAGEHVFSVSAESVAALGIAGLLSDLLPTAEPVTVAGTKWTVAKPGKVTAATAASGCAFCDTVSSPVANPSGLKLQYKAKDGTFRGSFSVHSTNPTNGRLMKTRFTVVGAAVNGVGYGVAYNKKSGSVPIEIR